jgi:hypothetical protein
MNMLAPQESFDKRIQQVARQLLGVKLAEFAVDTGDKLTITFDLQRRAINSLLAVQQGELNDILANDIIFPPVEWYDEKGGKRSRDMEPHEQTEYRKKLISDVSQAISRSIADLEKLTGIYLKLTAGGIGQAMLTVARESVKSAQLPAPADSSGEPERGVAAADDVTRRRFSAGRSAVIDVG